MTFIKLMTRVFISYFVLIALNKFKKHGFDQGLY